MARRAEQTEPDWMTPDIALELLFDWSDGEETPIMTSTCNENSTAQEGEASHRNAEDIFKDIGEEIKLSKFGAQLINKWISDFSKSKNPDKVIGEYLKYCCDAAKFFDGGLPYWEAADALLGIIEKIVSPANEADNLQQCEVRV